MDLLRLRYPQRIALAGFLFTLPAIIFFAIFFFYPMVQAFFMSLTDWSLLRPPRFVGLANYAGLFSDAVFRRSVAVTALYVAGVCGGAIPGALIFAVLLRSAHRLHAFFEAAYFLPTVVSLVVVSILWKFLLQRLGLVNLILGGLGVEPLAWLASSSWSQLAMIIVTVWRFFGYFVVLFLSGLAGIPREYEEAAAIDGAAPLQVFVKVTLPLLGPVLLLTLVVGVINAVQMFVPQYVVTRGGPADSTRVLVLLIYETAFRYLRMGEAAAMSIVLLQLLVLFTIAQFRLFGRVEPL